MDGCFDRGIEVPAPAPSYQKLGRRRLRRPGGALNLDPLAAPPLRRHRLSKALAGRAPAAAHDRRRRVRGPDPRLARTLPGHRHLHRLAGGERRAGLSGAVASAPGAARHPGRRPLRPVRPGRRSGAGDAGLGDAEVRLPPRLRPGAQGLRGLSDAPLRRAGAHQLGRDDLQPRQGGRHLLHGVPADPDGGVFGGHRGVHPGDADRHPSGGRGDRPRRVRPRLPGSVSRVPGAAGRQQPHRRQRPAQAHPGPAGGIGRHPRHHPGRHPVALRQTLRPDRPRPAGRPVVHRSHRRRAPVRHRGRGHDRHRRARGLAQRAARRRARRRAASRRAGAGGAAAPAAAATDLQQLEPGGGQPPDPVGGRRPPRIRVATTKRPPNSPSFRRSASSAASCFRT